jgi:PAS domain-containing protein
LERSLSLLHSTIESTADGILVVDRQGRIATYNKKFAVMWQIPDSAIATGQDEQLLSAVADQLEAPEEYLGTSAGTLRPPG